MGSLTLDWNRARARARVRARARARAGASARVRARARAMDMAREALPDRNTRGWTNFHVKNSPGGPILT